MRAAARRSLCRTFFERRARNGRLAGRHHERSCCASCVHFHDFRTCEHLFSACLMLVDRCWCGGGVVHADVYVRVVQVAVVVHSPAVPGRGVQTRCAVASTACVGLVCRFGWRGGCTGALSVQWGGARHAHFFAPRCSLVEQSDVFVLRFLLHHRTAGRCTCCGTRVLRRGVGDGTFLKVPCPRWMVFAR